MLTRIIVLTIFQYIQISNHYIVHLKLILNVNYTSIIEKTQTHEHIIQINLCQIQICLYYLSKNLNKILKYFWYFISPDIFNSLIHFKPNSNLILIMLKRRFKWYNLPFDIFQNKGLSTLSCLVNIKCFTAYFLKQCLNQLTYTLHHILCFKSSGKQ